VNAPPNIAREDHVLAEALARFAAILGDTQWAVPSLPFEARKFDELADRLGLTPGERLAAALLYAVEADPGVARAVAQVQTPVAGARCMAGLLTTILAREGLTVSGLWAGKAARAGLLVWGEEDVPLPERTIHMPPWLVAAFGGELAPPPGVSEPLQPRVHVPESAEREVGRLGELLVTSERAGRQPVLVIRGQCPAEVEHLAGLAARAAARVPCRLEAADAPGLGVWLAVTGRMPIVAREAAPGEPIDPGLADRLETPLVLATASEGQVVTARPVLEWRASIPNVEERRELWRGWGLAPALADEVAARYRQSSGRIAEIGRALGAQAPTASFDSVAAVMAQGGGRIDALARLSNAKVGREDIVLPAELSGALDRLRDRILMRNGLADGLGPTLSARYRPGVRALFTGESGTGKTLAAHWLAAQAGLPLYRVDLSAMTSKWIGETEKNISTLLDTAEQGDVLLFFDEADALFGSRTEVSDAHDRYANSQTNFLLQRIEDYTGVAILATNGRDRFDPAFARRLDMVLEFPLPDAAARRELWDRHLGPDKGVEERWLDAVAGTVDLAGGHIRNVVLAAAARARAAGRAIEAGDIAAAIGEEYAKLGRTAPPLPPC
jgi:hypothetical protein